MKNFSVSLVLMLGIVHSLAVLNAGEGDREDFLVFWNEKVKPQMSKFNKVGHRGRFEMQNDPTKECSVNIYERLISGSGYSLDRHQMFAKGKFRDVSKVDVINIEKPYSLVIQNERYIAEILHNPEKGYVLEKYEENSGKRKLLPVGELAFGLLGRGFWDELVLLKQATDVQWDQGNGLLRLKLLRFEDKDFDIEAQFRVVDGAPEYTQFKQKDSAGKEDGFRADIYWDDNTGELLELVQVAIVGQPQSMRYLTNPNRLAPIPDAECYLPHYGIDEPSRTGRGAWRLAIFGAILAAAALIFFKRFRK